MSRQRRRGNPPAMTIEQALAALASHFQADRDRALPIVLAEVHRLQEIERRGREYLEQTAKGSRGLREVQIARYIIIGAH